MLRFLVDGQALPGLMWLLVAESFAVVTVIGYLLAQRLVFARPVGEAFCRRALLLAEEIAPASGMLGTVCGLALVLPLAGRADAHGLIVRGLGTALYTTAVGIVVLLLALCAHHGYPWRASGANARAAGKRGEP